MLHIAPNALRLERKSGAIEILLEGHNWSAAFADLPTLPLFSRIRINIADSHVRYLRLIWPSGLSTSERQVFVAHRFTEVFGAGPWATLADRNSIQKECIAAALPQALHNAIQKWAKRSRLNLRAIEPAFLADFNQARHHFFGDGAFARQEHGRITIGLWTAGAWQALRSMPVSQTNNSAIVENFIALLATVPTTPAIGTLYMFGPLLTDTPLPPGWTHANCADFCP
jgi:hypothetical protein